LLWEAVSRYGDLRGGQYRRGAYPVLLEAFLRTEEAILDAKLQAGRALQPAGIVLAVYAQALPLGWRFRSHDGDLDAKLWKRLSQVEVVAGVVIKADFWSSFQMLTTSLWSCNAKE
jgi:hypothetical protein